MTVRAKTPTAQRSRTTPTRKVAACSARAAKAKVLRADSKRPHPTLNPAPYDEELAQANEQLKKVWARITQAK